MRIRKRRSGGYHHKYQRWSGVPDRGVLPRNYDTNFMGVFLEKNVKEAQAEMERRTVDLFRMKRVGDKYRWCMVHSSLRYRMKVLLGGD